MPAEIDVTVERRVPASPSQVARVFFDPDYDTRWMKAVERVEPLDPIAPDAPRVRPGSRVRRCASFLGRSISWITEIVEIEPDRRLVLQIRNGPFVGVVTYEIAPDGDGSLIRITNQGKPGQFAWMPRWMVTAAMRSSLKADLERLESVVLESVRT